MAAPTETAPTAAPAAPVAAAGDGQGDALDKGLSAIATKLGKPQSNANVEKASDGIRSLFKKFTGKDVPIADKDYK